MKKAIWAVVLVMGFSFALPVLATQHNVIIDTSRAIRFEEPRWDRARSDTINELAKTAPSAENPQSYCIVRNEEGFKIITCIISKDSSSKDSSDYEDTLEDVASDEAQRLRDVMHADEAAIASIAGGDFQVKDWAGREKIEKLEGAIIELECEGDAEESEDDGCVVIAPAPLCEPDVTIYDEETICPADACDDDYVDCMHRVGFLEEAFSKDEGCIERGHLPHLVYEVQFCKRRYYQCKMKA